MTALASNLICVVDDDESARVATAGLLRSAGYGAESFSSAQLFLARGHPRDFACLILDLRMPGIDGLELQRRLNSADSTLPIIFVSAHDDPGNRKRAMDAGAADFFRKPFKGDALLAAIASAIGRPDDAVDPTRPILKEAVSSSEIGCSSEGLLPSHFTRTGGNENTGQRKG